MNRRTGDEERKQDFINLDESECFDVVLNDTMYKFVNLTFLFLRPHEYGRGGREGGVWGTIRSTPGSKYCAFFNLSGLILALCV